MKKYIDTEKLINMIDNSIAYCQINYSDDYAVGFEQSLREVKRVIVSLQQERPDEQPEYGYLSIEYVHGKKPRWSVGDVLAYYICTSNEEGEYLLGKIVNVEFDKEDGWVYTFEDGSTWDEQSLVEEETYKKNYNGK